MRHLTMTLAVSALAGAVSIAPAHAATTTWDSCSVGSSCAAFSKDDLGSSLYSTVSDYLEQELNIDTNSLQAQATFNKDNEDDFDDYDDDEVPSFTAIKAFNEDDPDDLEWDDDSGYNKKDGSWMANHSTQLLVFESNDVLSVVFFDQAQNNGTWSSSALGLYKHNSSKKDKLKVLTSYSFNYVPVSNPSPPPVSPPAGVPLPAGLPLMATAFGLLAWFRIRRKPA